MWIEGTVGLHVGQSCPEDVDDFEDSEETAARGRGPRRGRVLVMDDERMVRDMMRRQLVIFGFEVVAAVNGQEAVNAYRRAHEDGRPFDVVILDLRVPSGWGGEQTISELLKFNPGVRALVCSGSLSGPVDAYKRLGFCGVLGKPYAMAELRAAVEAALPTSTAR
jgi:CheY-like chemotaxis protein